MRNVHGLSIGWVDTSIGELVRTRAEALTRFTHVLITSIDSSTDLHEVPTVQEVVGRYDGCGFLGRSLKMPAQVVSEITGTFNLFNGFDEVWWFSKEPLLPLPEGVTIVSPLDLREDELPEDLERWMAASGCNLGLGDGIGMNFVTPDATTANYVELSAERAE